MRCSNFDTEIRTGVGVAVIAAKDTTGVRNLDIIGAADGETGSAGDAA